ncbi:MAG: biotin--[acetyl-CoA-carboxylase] ligase [Pseudomonadota bacterium]
MSDELLHPRAWRLLQCLADGEFHSGEALAQSLGTSRATVSNALVNVEQYGISLQRVRGRGYRLATPWQRLDSAEIRHVLGDAQDEFGVEVVPQAQSSNTLLLQAALRGAPGGSVLAVELQTAGRGRRGRVWQSGLGNGLTFSLLWRFAGGLNSLSGLSLAVGIAIVRTLRRFTVQDVYLKWPNDVLSRQGKLAGVLIEAQGDMLGPSAVVIGIGLNYTLPTDVVRRLDQPASGLDELCQQMPTRNQLLAEILLELSRVLPQFALGGFAVLREEWERVHYHQNRKVRLRMPDESVVRGIACGMSDLGELCVQTGAGIVRLNAGEVEGVK